MNDNLAYFFNNLKYDLDSEGMKPVAWVNIDGSNIVVSRFKDKIWNLSFLFGQSNISSSSMIIDWSTIPIKQRNFWKSYMYAVLIDLQNISHRKGSNKLAGGTVLNRFEVIRSFTSKFVHRHKMTSILDLADRVISKRQRQLYVDAYIKESNDCNIAEYARRRLDVIVKLFEYKQAGYLRDGFDYPVLKLERNTFDEYIFPVLLRQERSGKSKRRRSTKEIPDVIMTKMATCIDECISSSNRILDAWEEYVTLDLSEQCKYLHSEPRRILVEPFLKKWGFTSRQQLVNYRSELYLACITALFIYTGYRDNEVVDINIDGFRSYEDESGFFHYYITTRIRKTSKDKEGIVHERPVSKAAFEAANILLRMTKNVREKLLTEILNAKNLLKTLKPGSYRYGEVAVAIREGMKHKNKLVLNPSIRAFHIYRRRKVKGKKIITPMLPYGVNALVGRNIKNWCQRNDIRDVSVNNNKIWNFTPHQGRVTLARYIAKYIRQDPYIVKWLFGHKGAYMSEYYMKGDPDEELRSWVEDQVLFQNSGVIENALTSEKPLAGVVGLRLMKLRENLAFKSSEEIAQNLAKGSTLMFNGHSWCFAEHGQKLCDFSECVLKPENCVDCPKTLITDQFLPLWKEMYQTTSKIVDYIEDPKIKQDHENRLSKSKKIIDSFEVISIESQI